MHRIHHFFIILIKMIKQKSHKNISKFMSIQTSSEWKFHLKIREIDFFEKLVGSSHTGNIPKSQCVNRYIIDKNHFKIFLKFGIIFWFWKDVETPSEISWRRKMNRKILWKIPHKKTSSSSIVTHRDNRGEIYSVFKRFMNTSKYIWMSVSTTDGDNMGFVILYSK